jgi:hypothetical protein
VSPKIFDPWPGSAGIGSWTWPSPNEIFAIFSKLHWKKIDYPKLLGTFSTSDWTGWYKRSKHCGQLFSIAWSTNHFFCAANDLVFWCGILMFNIMKNEVYNSVAADMIEKKIMIICKWIRNTTVRYDGWTKCNFFIFRTSIVQNFRTYRNPGNHLYQSMRRRHNQYWIGSWQLASLRMVLRVQIFPL